MKFKSDFFRNYLKIAPFSLASERKLECEIITQHDLQKPMLDIGCGDGIFAHLLFQNRVDTGIDINPTEVNKCRAWNAYEELLVCSADSIPKPDAYYNTILSNSVLEHIPDLDSVLKEAHRVLSDKGYLYITVPTDGFEQASVLSYVLDFLKLKNLRKKYMSFYNNFWRHYHCYTLEGWYKVLEKNGFKVVKHKEYNRGPLACLHDAFAPVALPSFFARKYLHRWFFFPQLRKITAPFLYLMFSPLVNRLEKSKGRNTLVFFQLAKK